MKSPIDDVRRVLTEVAGLNSERTVLVGVSGGLDSVVLLHLMAEVAGSFGFKIEVAHFNHGLRGKESDGDQRFVSRLAKRWKLSVHLGRMNPDEAQAGDSIEMTARRARHKFLADKALERGIGHVVLGHHADDQLETIFIRLFRGEGSSLAGIRALSPSPANKSIEIIRPLLGLRRSELALWAKQNALKFREDSSNNDEVFLRNRIRRRLIPLIQKQFSSTALDGILRSAEISGAEGDCIEAQAQNWLVTPSDQAFTSLPVPLQRRIIRAQLLDLKLETSFPRIEWLRENEDRVLAVSPETGLARTSAGLIKVVQKVESVEMDPASLNLEISDQDQALDWSGVSICMRRSPIRNLGNSPTMRRVDGRERFDADAVGEVVTLRHWRAGDRFQPIGMKTPVKLQDLFVSAKIPAPQRRRLVVAEAPGKGIFWVEGLRIAEGFKLQSTSVRYLEWRWNRRDAFLAAATSTC